MLYLKDPNLYFMFFSFAMMIVGVPAVIASAPKRLKDALLSFDKDGRKTALMGVTFVVIGLVVRDYASAYVFILGGLFVTMLGFWIAAPDHKTDRWLETDRGTFWFIAAALALFAGGAYMANAQHGFFYNVWGLLALILPVCGATFFMMVMVLAASSPSLKASLMPQNKNGANLIWKGALVLAIAPLAGINPALMVATATLAAGLMSLGVLVALWDKVTNIALYPIFIPAYCYLMYALLAWSRSTF